MIENQEELRTALEKNHKQKEWIKQLETGQTTNLDGSPNDMSAQLLKLQAHVSVSMHQETQTLFTEWNLT